MTLRTDFRSLEMDEMTAEERDRYNLECYVWGAYKDVNGIRPRWMNFAAMSEDELSSFARMLSDEIEEDIAREGMARQELAAAREDPNGFVWLNERGRDYQEFGWTIDPNDPELWDWAFGEQHPRVTIGDALQEQRP